jgi:hypothetical protein
MPFFYWGRTAQKLVPLDFTGLASKRENTDRVNDRSNSVGNSSTKSEDNALKVFSGEAALSGDNSLLSPPLSLNPLDYDLATLEFKEPIGKLTDGKENAKNTICLTAIGEDGPASFNATIADGARQVDIQLSERKGWFSHGQIVALALRGNGQTLARLTLHKLNELPELKATGTLKEEEDGICRMSGNNPPFAYDITMVKGAKGAVYELSRANAWFEHYSGTLREKGLSKEAAVTGSFSRLKGVNIPLSAVGVKGHGFFELKVAAADENGNPIGYFSEPLNFQL